MKRAIQQEHVVGPHQVAARWRRWSPAEYAMSLSMPLTTTARWSCCLTDLDRRLWLVLPGPLS